MAARADPGICWSMRTQLCFLQTVKSIPKLSHGTAWFSCMGRRVQAKRACARLSPKSSQFACLESSVLARWADFALSCVFAPAVGLSGHSPCSASLKHRAVCCVQLIEINAHSLFSKWFSESGKLVMKLFEQIQELVEDSDTFVCVMIDEVESLSAARKSSMGGSEPSDAIRVVNALLTQIDKLSRFPNVLVLTTSNITGGFSMLLHHHPTDQYSIARLRPNQY